MNNQVVTLYKNITLNHDLWLSIPVGSVMLKQPHTGYISFFCTSHRAVTWYICRTQLPPKVSRKFTQYKKLIHQVFKQQVPEDTCIPHPFKTTMVHKICASDHKARLKFWEPVSSWYCIKDTQDPTHCVSRETWFQLSG